LNRAVERAWASGIVVLAAAGNAGPSAETITVPGNDPYVITVGSVNESRTPGYWKDDVLPAYSSTGPTLDGFVKPDVLAPGSQIVSFMYNACKASSPPANCLASSQTLVQAHPNYSQDQSFFRMSGTSMATSVASGVVALMLQANPTWTPDQVKFRLMMSARQAENTQGTAAFNVFQQGAGRIWAPDAVLGNLPAGQANVGKDINADLTHGYTNPADLPFHYAGGVKRVLSDNGQAYLYYVTNGTAIISLGVAQVNGKTWLGQNAIPTGTTWNNQHIAWTGRSMAWDGGSMAGDGGSMAWDGGRMAWDGGRMAWDGRSMAWDGGNMAWDGRSMAWDGGSMAWDGRSMAWDGGSMAWDGRSMAWDGSTAWGGSLNESAAATKWVEE
jgi:serine protease AprX